MGWAYDFKQRDGFTEKMTCEQRPKRRDKQIAGNEHSRQKEKQVGDRSVPGVLRDHRVDNMASHSSVTEGEASCLRGRGSTSYRSVGHGKNLVFYSE